MGQTLSEPIKNKHTQSGSDDRFMYAVSEMQGWRLTMEDAHTAVLDLDRQGKSQDEDNEIDRQNTSLATTHLSDRPKTSFFAVYDGHGGSSVARFSGDTLHLRLRETEAYRKGQYKAALKQAFLGTDEALLEEADFRNDPSGCTAVVALFTSDDMIYVANAGDSRSVLSSNGLAKPLSFDHKPVNGDEHARILKAGGFVDFGRVNGNLALSRAIGDFEFKLNAQLPPEEQIVTSNPEIVAHEATPDDEFLVIACDGIWDVLGSQEVIDWVRRSIASRTSLRDITEHMMDLCLAPDLDWGGVGCDNMTVMVVALLGHRSQEEWYDEIARRVEQGVGYPTPKDLPVPFSQNGPQPQQLQQHQQQRMDGTSPQSSQRYVISTQGLPPNLINAMVSAGIVSQEQIDREQAEREIAEKKELTSMQSFLNPDGGGLGAWRSSSGGRSSDEDVEDEDEASVEKEGTHHVSTTPTPTSTSTAPAPTPAQVATSASASSSSSSSSPPVSSVTST